MVTGVTNNTSAAPASTLKGTTKANWQPIVEVVKESFESLLIRVISQYAQLRKERTIYLANQIDQNNQDLKQLGKANTDLAALLLLFPKDGDDKTIIDPRDGNKLREPQDDMTLKDAVEKMFANPDARLPELKSQHDNQDMNNKATNAMNKYLALVQSGLRSGVIKPEDKSKYQSLTVTKQELTNLGQAIKAQTDSLSSISTRTQTDLQSAKEQFQNAEALNSNLISSFGKAQSGIIANTR